MSVPGPLTPAFSFSDFQFKTIGKQRTDGNEPSLLRRMTHTNPESIRNANLGTVPPGSSPPTSLRSDNDSMQNTSSPSSSPPPTFSPEFAAFHSQFRSHHSRLSYILSSHTSTLVSSVAELSQTTHSAYELAQIARATSAECMPALEQCFAICQRSLKAAEESQQMCNLTQDKMKAVLDAHTKDELFIAQVKENLGGLNELIRVREGQERRWLKSHQNQERRKREEEDQRRRAELLEQMANYEAALNEIKNQLQGGGEGRPLQQFLPTHQQPNSADCRGQERMVADEPSSQALQRSTGSLTRHDKSNEQQRGEKLEQKGQESRAEEAMKKRQMEVTVGENQQREIYLRQLARDRRNTELQASPSAQYNPPSGTTTGNSVGVPSSRPSPVSSDNTKEKESKNVTPKSSVIKQELPATPAIATMQPMLDLGSDSSESSQISRGNLPLAHSSLWSGNHPSIGVDAHSSFSREQIGIRGGHPLPLRPIPTHGQLAVASNPAPPEPPSSQSLELPPVPQKPALIVQALPPHKVLQPVETEPAKIIPPPRPNATNARLGVSEQAGNSQTVNSQAVNNTGTNPPPARMSPPRDRTMASRDLPPKPTLSQQDVNWPQACPDSYRPRSPEHGWNTTSTWGGGDGCGSVGNWGGASPMGPEDERRQESQMGESERQQLMTEPLARRIVDHWSPEPDRSEPRHKSPSPTVESYKYRKRSREDFDDDEYPSQRRHRSPEDSGYQSFRGRNHWSPPPSERGLLSRLDDRSGWDDSMQYRRSSWSPKTPPRPYYPPSSPSPPPQGGTRRTFMERLDIQYPPSIPTGPRGRRGGRGGGPPRGAPPSAHYKGPLASRIGTASLQDRMRLS